MSELLPQAGFRYENHLKQNHRTYSLSKDRFLRKLTQVSEARSPKIFREHGDIEKPLIGVIYFRNCHKRLKSFKNGSFLSGFYPEILSRYVQFQELENRLKNGRVTAISKE